MGVFGRKKKKAVDEESKKSSVDNISDLELAYENCLDEAGYHYDDGESDYSEGGESVPPPPPPPPPDTESHYTREEIEAPINKDPYFTADSSGEKKDSTQRRRRRRNKILLLVAGCVPFCIVVGLASWYGYLYATTNRQQQQQSNTYASITSSEQPNNTTMAIDNDAAAATFDLLPSIPQEEEEIMYNSAASILDSSPIIPNEEEEIGKEEDEEGVLKSMIPEEKEKIVANENNVPSPPPVVVVQQETEVDTPATENNSVPPTVSTKQTDTSNVAPPVEVLQQEAEVDTPATENNNVPPTVSTKQTDTSSSSSDIGAATETQYIKITKQTDTSSSNIGATAATIDTIDTTIDGTISTDNDSSSDEMMSIVLSIDSAGSVTESTTCALDQILASSHCDPNGIAMTRIFLCLGTATPLADQFWAWSDVPPAYAQVEKLDWGWVKDVPSRGREVLGLPDGRYILGLYANGRHSSEDDEVYPLLASFEFVITCGEGN